MIFPTKTKPRNSAGFRASKGQNRGPTVEDGHNIAAQTPLPLGEAEAAWLHAHPKVRVGVMNACAYGTAACGEILIGKIVSEGTTSDAFGVAAGFAALGAVLILLVRR